MENRPIGVPAPGESVFNSATKEERTSRLIASLNGKVYGGRAGKSYNLGGKESKPYDRGPR